MANNREQIRLGPTALSLLVLCVAVLIAGCTTSTTGPPDGFSGMSPDEVGCTVRYGDEPEQIVGPLTASAAHDYEPNDFTHIHIGRTAAAVSLRVERSDASTHTSFAMNEFVDGEPQELVVGMSPSGQPGVRITCWNGVADS